MIVCVVLVFLLVVGLIGCVMSGDQNFLKIDKGCDEVCDVYIQFGFGYFQWGNIEQVKVLLCKVFEIDFFSVDVYVVLVVVFQIEMEFKLVDEEYCKVFVSDSCNVWVLNNYGGFFYEQKCYEEVYQCFLEVSQDIFYFECLWVFENFGLVLL